MKFTDRQRRLTYDGRPDINCGSTSDDNKSATDLSIEYRVYRGDSVSTMQSTVNTKDDSTSFESIETQPDLIDLSRTADLLYAQLLFDQPTPPLRYFGVDLPTPDAYDVDSLAVTTRPITTEPITTGPITTGPITTGPITTGPITTGPITSRPVTTINHICQCPTVRQSMPPVIHDNKPDHDYVNCECPFVSEPMTDKRRSVRTTEHLAHCAIMCHPSTANESNTRSVKHEYVNCGPSVTSNQADYENVDATTNNSTSHTNVNNLQLCARCHQINGINQKYSKIRRSNSGSDGFGDLHENSLYGRLSSYRIECSQKHPSSGWCPSSMSTSLAHKFRSLLLPSICSHSDDNAENTRSKVKDRFLLIAVCLAITVLALLVFTVVFVNVILPTLLIDSGSAADNQTSALASIWLYDTEFEVNDHKSNTKLEKLIPDGNLTKLITTPEPTTTRATSVVTTSFDADLFWASITQGTTGHRECPQSWFGTQYQYQFSCANGESRVACMHAWQRCDGVQDCSDASDEMFCEELNCYGNFGCGIPGECVSLTVVCNGLADCSNGRDERSDVCGSFQCQSYEYRCSSGYCIPREWMCDGDQDCADAADEYNCGTTCAPDEHQCSGNRCVTSNWACNGIVDCSDASDEQNCSCDELKCNSGQCLAANDKCDGKLDCPDGSDEWSCVSIDDNGLLRVSLGHTKQKLTVCADDWTNQASQFVCRSLGHSDVTSFAVVPVDPNTPIAMFNADLPPISSIIESLFISFLCTTETGFKGNTIPAHLQHALRRSISNAPNPVIHKITCQYCGSSSSSRPKRLVGGHVSGRDQWPTVVVLYHPGKKWTCNGVLVAARWIVTSALCLRRTDPDPSTWQVSVGLTSAPTHNAHFGRARRFVTHPNFKFGAPLSDFDVALVELEVSLPSSHPITCLPRSAPLPNTTCITVGWGYTDPGGFEVNTRLRHLEMSVVALDECNNEWHYNGRATGRHLCARASKGAQPCSNDEGAPLLCHDAQSWFVAGVLSAHSCQSHASHPVVYTNTHSVTDWLTHTVFG